MPRDPTTTTAGHSAARSKPPGKLAVDVGFWGGLVPGNAGDSKASRAGVVG
jgi:allantoinase